MQNTGLSCSVKMPYSQGACFFPPGSALAPLGDITVMRLLIVIRLRSAHGQSRELMSGSYLVSVRRAPPLFRLCVSGFLNLGTMDRWGPVILCGGGHPAQLHV